MTAFELIVSFGGEKTRIPVPTEPVLMLVGRDPECEVVVDDPGVDLRHLEVSMVGGSVRVRDLETRSGTKVNGAFVGQSLVSPGDEITLGGARIFVAAAKARPAKPAPGRPAPKKPAPAKPPRAPAEPRPAAARPRRKKSGGVLFLVGAVVLIAVGALAFLLLSESGRTKDAAAACQSAYALWERKRIDDAEAGFRAVVDRWPDTPSAPRAKSALEEIAAFRQHREEGLAARGKLLKRWAELTEEKLRKEWDSLAKTYEGTGTFDDVDAVFAKLGRRYEEEERRRLDATRSQAGELARAGRYWDAILAWHEYATLTTNVKPDTDAADREVSRIQAQAKAAYQGLARQAEVLIEAEKFDEAKALLRSRVASFRGTRHAFDLRQKLDRAEVLGNVETAEPEKAAEVVVKRDEFLREADRAEALVQGRRYGEAVALYRKTAERIPFDDLKKEFLGRAADLEDYAFLLDELRSQINADPARFRKIELGAGITASAQSANATHIIINIRGAQSKLAFARMGAGRILTLLVRLDLDPAGRVKLARFAFEAGDEDAGHSALTKALAKDESLSERAFAMLARARGIPVPEGGFVEYRGRWMTPTEKKTAELKAAIDDAAKLARSSDTRRRDAGLGTLRNFGEPAREALVAALQHQLTASVEELRTMSVVRDPATKGWLHAEIEKRRKAALVLIFDAQRYPYPYGPDGNKAVQAEVDGLVARVRQVWVNPLSLLMEKYPELKEVTDRASSYSEELAGFGHELEVPYSELVKRMNDAVGIRRYAPGGTEKSAREWNDEVLEYNRTIDIGADDPEKACVLATNEYRIMMGRRAVMMNDKLLKCARAHSTDMKENNFFAHDCPIPGHEAHRTPGQRAKIAGYGGGVSENIARGSEDGRSTFRQWYGSSGHHRNLLGKNHTEVGVGRNTDFWTQNFGSQKKKVDAPSGGGKRPDDPKPGPGPGEPERPGPGGRR
ncbi:MAG: FHA domain-containing protein [Planctomycetota bacterium]